MEQRINIGNSTREIIKTKELKVGKNIFIYNESAIPINNISKISIGAGPRRSYSPIYFIMMLVGLFMLFMDGFGIKAVGLLIMAVGAILIYMVYKQNLDSGEYLILNLNSGENVYFFSKNHDFIIETIDVIINCINTGKEYKVNFDNCKIESCQLGNDNTIRRN